MRNIFILLLSFLCLATVVQAQDTVTVKTFTYKSTTRDTVIDFPNGPDTYEKVLMLYNMRCKNGLVSDGNNRNRGCGEWDYSCNTYITDSSKIDSLTSTTKDVNIVGFSGSSFNYASRSMYNYHRHTLSTVNVSKINSEDSFVFGQKQVIEDEALPVNTASYRTQVLYTAQELIATGLSAGEITGLLFNSLNSADLKYLKILAKHTNLDSLGGKSEFGGFEIVYENNITFSPGANKIVFATAFNWDGMSNVIFEFRSDRSTGINPVNYLATDTDSTKCMTAFGQSFEFDGEAYIQSPYEGILGNASRSMDAWIRTETVNGEIISYGMNQQGKKWVFRINDNGALRVEVNGGAIVGKTILTDNEWHHVACVFSGTQVSDIQLYVDGKLEGIASTSSLAVNTEKSYRVRLSLGINNRPFKGEMDQVRMFNKALSSSEIESIMYRKINSTDPLYSSLVMSFDFDNDANSVIDGSSNALNATVNGTGIYNQNLSHQLIHSYTLTKYRPDMVLLRGDYNMTVSYDIEYDSVSHVPYMVHNRGVNPKYNTIYSDEIYNKDTAYYFDADAKEVLYDEYGTTLSTNSVSVGGSITVGTMPYMRRFPSVFEIMSFVTPYGIGLNLGMEGKTWTFDVTDFTPLLKGSKRMYISRGGEWQEEMDITFLFIKGTPPRDVLSIDQIWPTAIYSPTDNQIMENTTYFPEVTIPLDPNASGFKLRSAITGHGQEGEFVPRDHYLTLNGSQKFQRTVWKECASNPVYPQGGTWIYDRAGWCPGMATDLAQYEITTMVNPGDSISLDYGISGTNGTSRYIVNNQLVTYGPFNFENDAAITDVVSPSRKVEYARSNPMCTGPSIILRNTGSKVLTSVKVDFWVNDKSNKRTGTWYGTLEPMGEVEYFLPIDKTVFSTANENNSVFYAEIVEVNGGSDQYSPNNLYASPFDYPALFPPNLVVLIRSNSKANETTYRITNDWGVTVYERTTMDPNTIVRDTVYLGSGCHTLWVEDSDDDGISFWANSDGSGFVRLMQLGGGVLHTIQPDFGKSYEYNFTVLHKLGIDETSIDLGLNAYPNPTQGIITLEGYDLEGAEISLINHLGQTLSVPMQRDMDRVTMNLSSEAKGIYMIRIVKDGRVFTLPIVFN